MAFKNLGNVILDSSVIIKWFCEEEDTEKSLALREDFIQNYLEIAVPDLSLYEIANALRYNKSLKAEDVAEAVDSLFKLGIPIIVPTSEILNLAVVYAFKYNITVYDACFIALGKFLGFSCITADKKLYEKVKGLGFTFLLQDL